MPLGGFYRQCYASIGVNFCKAAGLEPLPLLFATSTPVMKLSSVVYQTRMTPNDIQYNQTTSLTLPLDVRS